MNETCQAALEAAFPPSTDAEVVRVVQQGILLADDTFRNVPYLNTMVGRDLRGHARRAAIMWRMRESCAAGDLPFGAQMLKMEKGNIHHLEIKAGAFKAHIVRTESVSAFPVQAESRQDHRLTSTQDLFENIVPFRSLLSDVGMYAWLTFGSERGGSLLHACWAMPAREEDEWLAHVNIMRRGNVSDGLTPTAAAEPPSEKLKLKFKDHIAEALEANDNAGDQTNEPT